MKCRRACVVLLMLAAAFPSAHAQPAPGDPVAGQTEAQVLKAVGKPSGRLGSSAKTYLYYPRGKIVLQNGLVTDVELQNPVVFAAQEAVRAQDEAREAEARAQQNLLLAVFLQDPKYLALPTRDRMLALERFHGANPAANVRGEYQALAAVYAVEQTSSRKIRKLQTEVANAQAQAATAQHQAAVAQQQAATAKQPAADAQRAAQTVAYNSAYAYPVVYAPPAQYIRIGNGTSVYIPPVCPPIVFQRPPAISFALNTSRFRFQVGSVAWAKANLPYNPARPQN